MAKAHTWTTAPHYLTEPSVMVRPFPCLAGLLDQNLVISLTLLEAK